MWEITIDHADSTGAHKSKRLIQLGSSFDLSGKTRSVSMWRCNRLSEGGTHLKRFSVIGILLPLWKNTISVSSARTEHAMLFVHLDETIICMTKAVESVKVCVKLMR